MIGMENRMPASPTDEPAVHRISRDKGKDKGEREAGPVKQVREAGLQGTGNGQHYRIVHDLHDRDRECVRGKRESQRSPKPHTAGEERTQGKRVAEEKGEDDCEGDRDRVPPPKHGSQNQTQYFPDRATGQAMDRGRKGKTVKWDVLAQRGTVIMMSYGVHARSIAARSHPPRFAAASYVLRRNASRT